MGNPRKAAFNVLNKIEENSAYSNIALNNEIKNNALDKRDSALAAALVYGALERKITLDYIIGQYSTIKITKIQPKVLNLLRIGVLQIVFMDKIPNSAVVNESVKIAKKNKMFSSSGFINAVLRNISKTNGEYKMPNREKNKTMYYSVLYSCPENLLKMWLETYGEELTELILKGIQGVSTVTVRVNTLKTTSAQLIKMLSEKGIKAETTIIDDALVLYNVGAIEELDLFKDGFFHVQDVSSQLCCKILNPQKGESIYDVCAAPGGKSFTVAQLMQNDGIINSYDMYDHKVKLIEDGAKRLGINIINAENRDATDKKELPKAQKVLCDVPCSGLGILKRKPEIRYKENTGINSLPEIQYEILQNSSNMVDVGGILVYSTCTLNVKENNENANKFLKENENFEPISIKIGNTVKRLYDEPENQLTIFPQKETDGFFISCFRRKY